MAIMRPLSKQSLSSDQKDIAIASLLDVVFRLNKCYTFLPYPLYHLTIMYMIINLVFVIAWILEMSALIKFKHLFILVLFDDHTNNTT